MPINIYLCIYIYWSSTSIVESASSHVAYFGYFLVNFFLKMDGKKRKLKKTQELLEELRIRKSQTSDGKSRGLPGLKVLIVYSVL